MPATAAVPPAGARDSTWSVRVVRGGSRANRPELLRPAYRGWCAPTFRNHLNGFRGARGRP